jgi:hypothetical protein
MPKTGKLSDDSSVPRCEVLAALMRLGGSTCDKSGRATRNVWAEIGSPDRSMLGLTALLRSMENDGQIIRDAKAKRTYEIALGDVAEHTLKRIHDLGLATTPPEIIDLDALTATETAPFVPVEATSDHNGNGSVPHDGSELGHVAALSLDVNPLADAILRRVGEILAGDNPQVIAEELHLQVELAQEETKQAQERLAVILEENQVLRRKAEEAGTEARMQHKRADGLAVRVAQVETNLAAVLRPGARVLDDTARRELTRLMQAAPTGR